MNDSSFTVTITFTNKFNLGRDDRPGRPMVSGQSDILQSGDGAYFVPHGGTTKARDHRPYRAYN